TEGIPGLDGFGTIAQGYLEMSNVNVVEEMVGMIIAQRAYEVNSKAIQTADNMLQMANNIKR
ncbi:MAG: flagellar basal body rod protein FlgG, partial [Desulfobacterales bacterium]|nr:flagellar basal body rod protein FlgG [Desulfobacterales bacterium]